MPAIWTKKDRVFFSLLRQVGHQVFDREIQEATHYLRTHSVTQTLYPIGHYDEKHSQFIWNREVRLLTMAQIRDHYLPFFGSLETVNRLTEEVVPLSPSNRRILPYLICLLNANFRVISVKKKGVEHYGMIKLPLPSHFDFDAFDRAMESYRKMPSPSKVGQRHRKTRKRQMRQTRHTR
jgi:hypothetical protein